MKKIICFLSFILITLTFGFAIQYQKTNVINTSAQNESVSFDSFSTNVVDMFSYDQNSQFMSFSTVKNSSLTETKKFNRLIVKSYSKLDDCGAIAESGMFNGFQIFQYASQEDTNKAYNYFSDLDNVEYVEYDYEFKIYSDIKATTTKTYINEYYDDIGVNDFNNFLTTKVGIDNLNDVVVAVLDTGIDTDHEFFTNRIAEGGRNFIDTTKTYEDDHGHGTHVSGTIVDLTYDNVKILPIKVSGADGKASGTSILLGLQYVYELVADDVLPICTVNMSFGGYGSFGYGVDLINNLYDLNVLSICAAGNDNKDTAEYVPANIEKAITVSAVYNITGTWEKADFSNWGDEIDIAAPGVAINSAQIGGGTIEQNGTSMATPHVAAAVALINSYNNTFNSEHITNLIKGFSLDCNGLGFDMYFGSGVLNLSKAHLQFIDEVKFDISSQECTNPFNLQLSCLNANKIIYTLDGSFPSLENGLEYTGPILINKTTRVFAVGYVIQNGIVVGSTKINYQTYIFNGNNFDCDFAITNDGTITNYTGEFKENIIIPEEIQGITVKKVESKFDWFYGLLSVTLPETITELGSYAFANIHTLQTINIENVVTLQDHAFSNCINLQEITLDKTTIIKESAFSGCTNLKTINLQHVTTIENYAFENCTSLQNINLASVETIGIAAFQNCDSLLEVELKNAKLVDNYAFSNCDSLTSVIIQNIETFNIYVFINCKNLETATIKNIKTIPSNTFSRCEKLYKVYLENVEIIDEFAFCMCYALKEINLENITDIGLHSFISCNQLESIDLSNVQNIGVNAFKNCKALAQVNLGSCQTIKESAFEECTSLKEINLDNVKNINKNAFKNCDSLTILNLTNTNLNNYAFSGCDGLKNLKWEANYSYYDNIFENCLNLTHIELPNMTSLSGENIFYGCKNLETVIAPKLTDLDFGTFYNCIKLTNFNFDNLRYVDGYNPNLNKPGAFENCTSLPNKIYLPNLTHLGSNTFKGSSVDKIVVGENFSQGQSNGITNATIYGINKEAEDFASICDNSTFIKINNLQILEDLPATKSILINESSTLSIQTTGFDQTYEWYVCDNEQLNNPQLIEGQTTNVLTITPTTMCTKYYFVKVTNWDGTTVVSNSCAVKALIDYSTYKIEINYNEGGYVSPGSEESINTGENRTYKIYVNKDYFISNISIDDQYYNSNDQSAMINEFIENGITFENISENHSIRVYFQHNPINVTIGDYSNGYVVVNFQSYWELPEEYWDAVQAEGADINEILKDYKNISKYYKESITFNITPKDGYYIKNLIINGEAVVLTEMSTYTFESLEEDSSISAVFERLDAIPYTTTHYKETLENNYDIEKDGKYYILYKTESLTGAYNSLTNATSENIAGYTAQSITQQQIKKSSDINIEIFYDLNIYSVTINDVKGVITTGEGNYKYTQTITIKAEILHGYNWSKWQCGLDEINNAEYTFSMPCKNLEFNPIVFANIYNIDVTIIGNGTVNPGDSSVSYGESKLFNFIPDNNNEVDYVEIDGVNIGKATSYLLSDITNNHTIKVVFKANVSTKHEITIIYKDSYGTIECSEGLTNITSGDSRTLNIKPNEGYELNVLKVNGLNALVENNTYEISNIDKNYTLEISFKEIITYTITVSQTLGGTISPTTKNYKLGSDQTFTIIPNKGYNIVKLIVDGKDFVSTNMTYYVFSDINSNHSISAVYELQKINITFNINKGTLVSGSLTQSVEYGNNAIAPIVTRDGYIQDGWDKPLTNILSDTTITAKWKPITYTIKYNLMGGTNNLNNPNNYNIESNTIVLQEAIKDGFIFDGWYYNSNFTGDRVYTITQGSIGDLNLFAKFSAKKYLIVFDLESTKLGNISCIDGNIDNVKYGDSLTFEITADPGYEVEKVLVNNIETAVIDNKFTVSNIQENTNIQLIYKKSSSITPPTEDNPDIPKDTSILDDNAKYIIYAGIGLIALLLIILIIIISKNKKKTLAINDNQNSDNNSNSTYNHSEEEKTEVENQQADSKSNSQKIQQVENDNLGTNQKPNPLLKKALDYVKGKEQYFITFCTRHNIDYQNNYNNAVLRYYLAYLRSTNPTKPPQK